MAGSGQRRKMKAMTLGEALRSVRGAHSQVVVAEKVGVSQPSVSAWERGADRPDLDAIRAFEQAVGAEIGTVLWLAGYVGETVSVEAAILSDDSLKPTDRESLRRMYRALRDSQ